jgi:hypothetical protein
MIKFATFHLCGPTKDWWTRVQEVWEKSGMDWSWRIFMLVFRAEFIPQWMVEKIDDEFQNLRQGGMTVAQYAAEFNSLSKYCRQLVDTEHNRTRQFIKGLRPELRRALALFPPSNYSTTVDAAIRTENEDNLILGIKSQILARSFRTKDLLDNNGTIKGNKLALCREAVI